MKEHKTILETGVKSNVAFCLGPSIEKTNGEQIYAIFIWSRQLLRLMIPQTTCVLKSQLFYIVEINIPGQALEKFSENSANGLLVSSW